MIGCIVLTAFVSLMAVKFLAHRRLCHAGGPRGWHGHHAGWHAHPWGGFVAGPWHGFGPGPRSDARGGWIWSVLARLDLSPAQERVVRAEVQSLKGAFKAFRDEGAQSRADIARAVAGDDFDEQALAAMFIRHDDRLHTLRSDLGGALGRIHAVLDPAQRERLAEIIERGGSTWGGPYRGATTEL